MRRLYFLIPSVDSAKTIVDELLLARIEQRHIHIAAADHHALTEANLPEANLLQESDFVPAVERGVAIGGATGILAGVAAVALPGVGLALGGGAILGIGLAGAGLGHLGAGGRQQRGRRLHRHQRRRGPGVRSRWPQGAAVPGARSSRVDAAASCRTAAAWRR